MSENILKARIQHLHKTEAEWQSFEQANPNFILRAGEIAIYDVDQKYSKPRFKFGDGATKLSVLPFIGIDIDISSLNIDFDAGRITSYTENE